MLSCVMVCLCVLRVLWIFDFVFVFCDSCFWYVFGYAWCVCGQKILHTLRVKRISGCLVSVFGVSMGCVRLCYGLFVCFARFVDL